MFFSFILQTTVKSLFTRTEFFHVYKQNTSISGVRGSNLVLGLVP